MATSTMSTFEPFTYRGLRNGLPFCLPRVDVSGWDYVNPMTLEQMFKLFWRLETVDIAVPTADGGTHTATLDNKRTDFPPPDPNFPEADGDQVVGYPAARICSGLAVAQQAERASGSFGDQFFFIRLELARHPNGFAALYDGATDDSNNLIGYGTVARVDHFGGGGFPLISGGLEIQMDNIEFFNCHYVNAVQYASQFQPSSTLSYGYTVFSLVTLFGLPFVRVWRATTTDPQTGNGDIPPSNAITNLTFFTKA